MGKTLVTLLLSAAVLVGCGSKSKHDNRIIELPANSMRAQWTRTLDMEGEKPRAMYISGDSLFVYSTNNTLYRLNRKSGDLVFISDVIPEDARTSAPVVLKDQLIIPADTKLHLVDGRGFRAGVIDLHNPIRSGVVADANGVYLGVDAADSSGRLACVDLDKVGAPFRWQLLTGGTVISTPGLSRGVVYAGSDDGRVYAVDADRLPMWNIGSFKTNGAIRGDITAEPSGVYVASEDSKLYCLDPADGHIRWQYFAETPLYDSPAVTSTSVYINVRDRGLTAIDKLNGGYNRSAKWTAKEARQFLAEDENLAFLRSWDNKILAVDKSTGETKFSSERRDLVAFAINTSDGLVYAATKGGKVFAAVPVTKPGAVGELVFLEPQEAKLALASR